MDMLGYIATFLLACVTVLYIHQTELDKKLDLVGIIVVGLTVALGGGTLRDIFFSRQVFWIMDTDYYFYAFYGIWLGQLLKDIPFSDYMWLLRGVDSFCLAIFTYMGLLVTATYTDSSLGMIVGGIFTGCAGGVIRDIFCQHKPIILHKDVIVGVTFMAGFIFGILKAYEVSEIYTRVIVIGIIFMLREFGWRYREYREETTNG